MTTETTEAGRMPRDFQLVHDLYRRAEESSRRTAELVAQAEALRRTAEQQAAQVRADMQEELAALGQEVAELRSQRDMLNQQLEDLRERSLRSAQLFEQQANMLRGLLGGGDLGNAGSPGQLSAAATLPDTGSSQQAAPPTGAAVGAGSPNGEGTELIPKVPGEPATGSGISEQAAVEAPPVETHDEVVEELTEPEQDLQAPEEVVPPPAEPFTQTDVHFVVHGLRSVPNIVRIERAVRSIDSVSEFRSRHFANGVLNITVATTALGEQLLTELLAREPVQLQPIRVEPHRLELNFRSET